MKFTGAKSYLLVLAPAAVVAGLAAGCGSTTTTTTSLAAADSVVVHVTAPTSGTVIDANRVTVRGTVTPSNAAVDIAGKPAAVGNGVFTGSASLQSGKTTIDVIGSAPNDAPGSTSIQITRAGHQKPPAKKPTTTTTTTTTTTVPPTPAGPTSCGGGLSAGPDTSCPFAINVEATYRANGAGSYPVHSPVTGLTYTMTCEPNGDVITCTGGNNASVSFPA